MRSETRRQDRHRKSFYCGAWESRVAGGIQTGRCGGGPARRGEKGSKAGGFKMAIDCRSGLDPHRSIGDRQLSFLATTKTKKFRHRISYSRKKHRSDAV